MKFWIFGKFLKKISCKFQFYRKICKFCYPRSFMIFSSIISWNFGEKISYLSPKLKILQTIFQNPTYITFFGIFLEKWNNIVFMYLILLEILCWVRIWFRIWCATNGSLAIAQNVSFLNKMCQSVQKWHILRSDKRTVCRTSNLKPYSDSVKNFWKNEIHEHYIISFFQKISKKYDICRILKYCLSNFQFWW